MNGFAGPSGPSSQPHDDMTSVRTSFHAAEGSVTCSASLRRPMSMDSAWRSLIRQSPADMRLRTCAIRPRLRSFVIGFSRVVHLGVVGVFLGVARFALVAALPRVALVRVQVEHELMFRQQPGFKRFLLENLAVVISESPDLDLVGR